MSLDVAPHLLKQAEVGEVNEAEFADTVAASLPYAHTVVEKLAADLHADPARQFADNQIAPTGAERAELLRALASDAIRGSLERRFAVKLAFQNCHRVAVFRPEAVGSETYRRFTSERAQILNQSPELRDC
ncbi:SCO5389 family protein [Catenulispora rubra]|uniref:SCO5389 family protein n=1 Tax=Catenulispora rubra TaxID=280293 RepID=UPI0018922815|nr:SCO5389 family protein [Catenulispora rubra]